MLTIDARQLRRLERTLGHIKNGVPRAVAPAINRALDKGRTTVKREIRKEYLIKYGDIPIKVQRANSASLNGAVVIRDGMLPLNKFKVSPRGVTKRRTLIRAQVKRHGGGGILRHAFNTTLGYPGPYERMGDARLPIRKLLTIGAPIMASQPTVGPEVNRQMGDTLAKRLDHEMLRILNQG